MTTPSIGRLLDEEEPEIGRIIGEDMRPSSERFRPGAGGKALLRGLYKAAQEASQATPVGVLTSALRGPPIGEESIEAQIDDPEAGFTEKVIERGVQTLPYLLGGEAGLLAKLGRSGVAALLGQATEEAGGGELAQTAAEIGGLSLPGLRSRIVPRKGQQEILDLLRRRGLTEKEIGPLIPTERKSAALGKLGTRNFRTKTAAQRTRNALGDLYGQLAEEGEQLPILSSNRASLLESQLNEQLEKMPSRIRKVIQEDLSDLFRKPVKANDLMNFWQDINSQINWKSMGGGKKRLNSLKDVLKEGINDINPALARDFELINQQYSKFNKIYRNLKPESLDRWSALGEAGLILGGIFKYGPRGAIPGIGVDLSRRIASELLINPRLQNLSSQMIRALNTNKLAIARKIQERMRKELEKEGIDIPNGRPS